MRLISNRIFEVQQPIIPEVADLIQQNPGTISLGQGVVYFKPPSQIYDGIARFKESANHHYEPVEGITELREQVLKKIQTENGISADNITVTVTAGSNMGFLNAILAICDPGDEVILIRPWYFNHEMALRIANCTPVYADTNDEFKPDLANLERAITDKTRAIVTISPNNPTGAVYEPEFLRAINYLCRVAGIYHISDEAYEYFCYGNIPHYSPASDSSASQYTITLYSVSKCFGMANWRIGYMIIPEHLFGSVRKIQDTNLICPPVISQYAALECIKLGRSYSDPKIAELKRVRTHLLNRLQTIDHLIFGSPDGALYAFLELPNIGMSDMDIVRDLIENYQVAVIPGQAFGVHDRCSLRVSYGALEPDRSFVGIDRLVKGLNAIMNY